MVNWYYYVGNKYDQVGDKYGCNYIFHGRKMMYQAVTITSNGNRYKRTLYAITFIRDYMRDHPDGLRRFVIDEDIAKEVRAQFRRTHKVKIVKRRWGNGLHNELTYITIEDLK